jgi:hypothetical protein
MIAYFLHEFDTYRGHINNDHADTIWLWLSVSWVALQIPLLLIDFGNRNKYKFVIQILLTWLLLTIHGTWLGILYLESQDILDIVPFSASYGGFVKAIILVLAIVYIAWRWRKNAIAVGKGMRCVVKF